ncbi:MAG: hypothetical protein EBR02_03615 [Alphaproteobacteria bacterium]|nr:hypothetical protein [Alphaproteobacteria bacterium]
MVTQRKFVLNGALERVRLADAYQHIGKSEYSDWVDHEIGVFLKDKVKIADLSAMKQPSQKRLVEPQYVRITNATLLHIPISAATTEQIKRHQSAQELIEKIIKARKLNLHLTKGLTTTNYEHLNHGDIAVAVFDFLHSTLKVTYRNRATETYTVMVEGVSLYALTKDVSKDRRARANTNSNAGRKVSADSKEIYEIIRETISKNPDIKVRSEMADIALKELERQGHHLKKSPVLNRIRREKLM